MSKLDKWKEAYAAKHGWSEEYAARCGLVLGKKIEPGVVSQSFIDKLRALGADEKWLKQMEFDNLVRQAQVALRDNREYSNLHYKRLISDHGYCYEETVCRLQGNCRWCILDIEVIYEDS